MGAAVRIAILADGARARAEMGATAGAASKMGAAFGRAGSFLKTAVVGGAVAATVAVGAFAAKAVKDASDLNETLNKTDAIFGKNAASIRKWAEGAATSTGLSKSAALEAASGFGDMFSQIGFTQQAAAKMSTSVVGLAADFGSFNNLPTEDVAQRISAAFRGEYDSLQALVPNINAARVEQEALTATGKKAVKQLTAQDKATAVLNILNKDGARAVGDFARTSEGAANKQKILSARMENVSSTVGQLLLPAYNLALTGAEKLIGFISSTAVPAFQKWAPVVGDLATKGFGFLQQKVDEFRPAISTALTAVMTVAKSVAAGIVAAWPTVAAIFTTVAGVVQVLATTYLPVLSAAFSGLFTLLANPAFQAFAAGVGAVLVALKAYSTYLAVVRAATAAWAVVQAALNVVLTANPIGLVVLAIVGLVAAFVVAYKQSETFRNIVDGVWKAVKTATSVAVSAIVGFLTDFWSKAQTVWNAVRSAGETVWKAIQVVVGAVIAVVTGYVNTYRAVVLAVWNAISTAGSVAFNAVKFVVQAVVADITGKVNTVRSVAVAVWNAISSAGSTAFNAVKSVVSSVASDIGSRINSARGVVNAAWSAVQSAASTAWNAIVTIVGSKIEAVKTRVASVISSISGLFSAGTLFGAGQRLIQGLADGVGQKIGAVVDKVREGLNVIKGMLPGSPIKHGPLKNWNDGGAGVRLMNMLRDGIAKGGTGAVSAMRSVADSLSKASYVKGLKGGSKTANRLRDIAGDLRQEAAEYALADKQLDATKSKLDRYKDKLGDLVKARNDYAANIRDAVARSGSILSIDMLTKTVLGVDAAGEATSTQVTFQTLANIKKVFAERAAQVKQFATDIIKLQKAGFSRQIIEELAAAGAEASGATVAELLKAKPRDVEAINRSQQIINDNAAKLGSTLAKTYFQNGINQAQGIIDGLKSRQADIEKTMREIAEAANAAYRKALKIKSPSRVMAENGSHTIEGLAQGMLSQIPRVERAMERVATAVAASDLDAQATLTAMGRGAAGTAPVGAGGVFRFEGSPSPEGKAIIDALKAYTRLYGPITGVEFAG